MINRSETMVNHEDSTPQAPNLLKGEVGAMGYAVAWLLGVPASVLFLVFLLRGCN
jgi:hypothetical protein